MLDYEIELYNHQYEVLDKMHNGCILVGGVGSGKSRTSIAYYLLKEVGDVTKCKKIKMPTGLRYTLKDLDTDLYIITTARKRDTLDWEDELRPFGITYNDDSKVRVHVDSWNNVKKYVDVKNSFFIFDEQRVVGYGTWTKSFLKITKNNHWILLSATPGDTWSDYIPVFVANGFYKNKTDFISQHAVYSRFSRYPKIEKYIETQRLFRLRKEILVEMPFKRSTEQIHLTTFCDYDKEKYKVIFKNRWNPDDNVPIEDAGQMCLLLRKLVNLDDDRLRKLRVCLSEHNKVVLFYNFNAELEKIKELLDRESIPYSEWNGHKHEPILKCDQWVYLVQYNAGAEGWNCTDTDTIIFFSQNYSYKVMIQSAGRIDRMNTPYSRLYYYHFMSRSPIDRAIEYALKRKKNFNESKFVVW